MDELLSLLSETENTSGETLCRRLGITRAAVWKRMEKLREEGYYIEASGKRGYRLLPAPNCLLPGYVSAALTTRWAGRGEIFYQTSVTSTNTLLKEAARKGAPIGSLYICEEQTQGRGRLKRVWEAGPQQNLLHSLLLRPKLPLEQAQLFTLGAAVAMANAIEEVTGLSPGIKWPNDIILRHQKCAGILGELSADMDSIHFIVVGIGVNVNQRVFPETIKGRATSLLLEAAASGLSGPNDSIDRQKLLCAYLAHMEPVVDGLEKEGLNSILPEYTRRSVTLGAKVRVLDSDGEWSGIGERLDDTGALWVRDNSGILHRVLSGDVSVRGVMGYVET